MSKFKVGDKVRVIKGVSTYPGWVGVEGIVESNDTWNVHVRLTTEATGEENPRPVGYVAQLMEDSIELMPPVKFPVGTIVEFWDEGNDHWQGGKGKVTANPSVTYDREGFVDVEILEEMPLNTVQKVGKVVDVPENHLREHLEEWEREILGWDMAPKPYEVAEEVAKESVKEAVTHPAHYGGDTTYEVIKVAEAWGLDKDAYLFNVLKYIARAGKKGSKQEDLQKADFYLDRRIANPLEEAK